MRAALLLLAALIGLAVPSGAGAQAPDAPIAGRRVALVIGNAAYRSVERLPNAANDAQLMATTLRGLGFELVGGGAQVNLDRAGLSRQVQEFGRALAGAEVGLFYYAGHGLQVGGVNWLVPVDANPTRAQDLDFQMVDADLVLRQMSGAGTRLNLVLLDACRNNPFLTRGLRSVGGGLAEMRAPEGTLLSYATQPGNVAVDGMGTNSPYTAALAEAMRQPGLDVFRLFNRVGLQVKRATGGSQQPWVSTSPIEGDFYFAGAAAVPPARVAEPAPPAGPGPAPPAPDPTERLITLAREQRCSLLEVSSTGGRISVSGLAPSRPDWDGFLRQAGATRGIRLSPQAVEFLPAFACEPVDLLAPPVRATRVTAGRLMTLTQREVAAGGTLTLTLRGTGGEAVLLDLFQPDGTVRHVPVPAAAAERRVTVVQPAGSPPGPRLLTALVSPVPLDLGARPTTEPAGPYLAALQRALQSGPEVRADVVTFEVRVPPSPRPPPRTVAGTSAAPSGRCTAVLQRAQLGEALSDADRALLRTGCP
ncbi:caspase family protein [Muricoccus radiodurans]|uniref:caspase family protein n=1 Tax=Muricoccus radiodurans TaxID=2231721 RepID=UPI003CEF75FA